MKKKSLEINLHILGWLLFLLIPLLISPKAPEIIKHELGLYSFLPFLISSVVLIIIFYINYFIFIPKFLFLEKYLLYCVICIVSIILAKIISVFFLSLFIKPNDIVLNNPVLKDTFPLVFANSLLMFFVVFLASIGLRLNNRWKQTEKEKISAQLSYLKMQVNPHFLFNTLNSIYSITISKLPQAAEMIAKLSDMMRYSLKETKLDYVPLENEINYISNYIDLQKVRFDDSVKLTFEVEGNYYNKQIAPLLLIPFIENAFKHGVNSEQNSNIKIRIYIKGNEIQLLVINNKVKVENSIEDKSGLGIENTKIRLDLIYPSKHIIDISETEVEFIVKLNIDLQ
jgi:sensor histidine kinase YesM